MYDLLSFRVSRMHDLISFQTSKMYESISFHVSKSMVYELNDVRDNN